MKMTWVITGLGFVLCFFAPGTKHKSENVRDVISLNIDTVNYSTQVLPLLQHKCSPCHFAGGKMYNKMPFDNSLTILSHEAGIFKRFNDKPEATLIKRFILQHTVNN